MTDDEPGSALDAHIRSIEDVLEAIDDVTRVRSALRVLESMPVDELELYTGALSTASRCTDFDSDDIALVLSLWRSLEHRHGLAGFLLAVVDRSPRQAKVVCHEQGLVGPALVDVLRLATDIALREARTEQEREQRRARREGGGAVNMAVPATSKRLDDLRAWANDVDGVDADPGLLADFQRTLPKLGVWSALDLTVLIEVLAQIPAGIDVTLTPRDARALAGDVGQVVTDESTWPHILLLARHVHRLGLDTPLLQRVLAQVLAVSMRAGDTDAIKIVTGLVGDDVVVSDILAYNLACLAAQTGDRFALLRFTARALALGKKAAQFEDDGDFDDWRDDDDFRALLQARVQ